MVRRRGRPQWLVATAMVLTSLIAAADLRDDGGLGAAALLVASLVVLGLALFDPVGRRRE